MAENESTKEYVLAADGMRLDGRRYRRGDKVRLPAEQGDRLIESGSLVASDDDLAPRDTTAGATAGLAPVAGEHSTLYGAQTIDDDGEVLPSSFGHPDRVKEAEEAAKEQEDRADATRPAAARRRTSTTTAADTTSTASGETSGETGGEKTSTRTARR
jgi:hypothetical protein